MGSLPGSADSIPPFPTAGITQEKINEMRAAPEQQMISDIHCMIAAGQDLDWVDAQGATLVRRGVRLDWAGGSGPEPRPAGAEWGQHWVEVKPTQACSLEVPRRFGDRVAPGMWRVSRAGIICFEKLGLGVGSHGLGRLDSTVHLFCLQTSPLPYTPGVHSEFIISTSSHDVSCFKTGATFIHSSRASCFAPFILLPQCTLSHLSALFHCLSLMLLQQPLFWFPDFRAQTPPGTHPSLVHPSSGSPIHLWFTHPSFSSPIHPLVHTSIHWFTHPSIGPPIHPLVHPSIHWSTHPSIGPPIHHWSTHPSIGSPIHPINIHILCATCFTRHWRQRMMESSLSLCLPH